MNFLLIASFPDSLLAFRGALLDTLRKKGATIHVAAPGLPVDSPLRQAIEDAGCHVHDFPLSRAGMNPLVDLWSMLCLMRLMARIKPDIVLAYTIKPVVYGLLAAKVLGVPRRIALVTGLGYSFQNEESGSKGRQLLRKLVQRLYSLALKGSAVVFFQNPDDEALFRSRALLTNSTRSVVVNGSGVDTARYNVEPFPQVVSFLLIARLLGDKGVREYVAAARIVKQAHPGVIFNLVGWIDENPDAISVQELEQWVADGVINYLGRLDDVRSAISDASVYVLPSYREGTPRTVLEAMAMGRAIITTDAPGCRETVEPGYNGFLVPVKDVVKLAEAMCSFITQPAQIGTMGNASRTLAEQKYDVNKVNEVMVKEIGM